MFVRQNNTSGVISSAFNRQTQNLPLFRLSAVVGVLVSALRYVTNNSLTPPTSKPKLPKAKRFGSAQVTILVLKKLGPKRDHSGDWFGIPRAVLV